MSYLAAQQYAADLPYLSNLVAKAERSCVPVDPLSLEAQFTALSAAGNQR